MRALVESIRGDAAAALTQLAEQASAASGFPERMKTNVLSMRLIADVHAALLNWSRWAEHAVDVLESENDAAVEAQTRDALAAIAATMPDAL